MSKILGLDLGTNSIGWALIDDSKHKIINAGSRIIPMDGDTRAKYESGSPNLKSPAATRTDFRRIRRTYERAKLRRERLLRILHVLGFLPKHYEEQIDFDIHKGQFKDDCEPLLAYRKDVNGKNEFIFKDSFNEMIADYEKHNGIDLGKKKIPYDWTIYYLRHKALNAPVSREELAWILLQFNTKRGYYQLPWEEDEEKEKTSNKDYMVLTVTSVNATGEVNKKNGKRNYEITYNNGAVQNVSSIAEPRQIGEKVELIVTTKVNKKGETTTSVKEPDNGPDQWFLMKKRSEKYIQESGKTVGDYIYEILIENPNIKIRGKEVRTIERDFYKDEISKILEKQSDFIPELTDKSLLQKCILELYPNNIGHANSLEDKSLSDVIINDVLFYQRELRSKKSLISDCPYEKYHWIDKETGEIHQRGIKVIPKSHPLFQEYRIRKFIQDLNIIAREKRINGKLCTDVDVTNEFIKDFTDLQRIYDFLSERQSINNTQLLKFLGLDIKKYRWNFVEDKTFPCAETHCLINKDGTLNKTQETELWHILYSVKDPTARRKAITTFANKNDLEPIEFTEEKIHVRQFDDDYGSFSEKALKKILPLMRFGDSWSPEDIPEQAMDRINDIINGVVDDNVKKTIARNGLTLTTIDDFQNLPSWFAEYLIYGDKKDYTIWKSYTDIDEYLKFEFKRADIRNPIVETVLGETLRVVRDIWKCYGRPNEIHIEMGRDLKLPKDKRAKATQQVLENEGVNIRIRQLLQEFAADDSGIENVRANSTSQMEILKIFEGQILDEYDKKNDPNNIMDIVNSLTNPAKHVSHNDVIRYKCWMEQRYRSPYTGDVIPLSKLFTPEYEIEHIIPKARYYDDSLNNKVICERAINRLKNDRLGYEFIIQEHGHIVGKHKVMEKESYEIFVKDHYAHNPKKAKILLMEDVPESFIHRQMNDTRYIARKTTEILSAAVRKTASNGDVDKSDCNSISTNIISSNGKITDRLKKDWGLAQIWNRIVTPRFIRLNHVLGPDVEAFGKWVQKDGERYFQIDMPLAFAKGFSKKRIDHRHHAMDAIVIACTTLKHINLMNNASAKSDHKRHDLSAQLCKNGIFIKPWPSFTQDVQKMLDSIIVSFKQNLRVMTKTTNYYWHYNNGKKVLLKQTKGDDRSIRRSLHTENPFGKVNLKRKKMVKIQDAINNWNHITDKRIRRSINHIVNDLYHGNITAKTLLKYIKDRNCIIDGINISSVEVYTSSDVPMVAKRECLSEKFNEERIKSISDTAIQKILLKHLKECNGDPKDAFSPGGIASMNNNIKRLNDGKNHKPIYSVRIVSPLGNKFPVGIKGVNSKKYVITASNTNLFTAVYEGPNGRTFESIPFNVACERRKQGIPVAPVRNSKNAKLLFTLSPGDLVYMPDEGEHVDDNLNPNKIWKMVKSSAGRICFIPHRVAKPIVNSKELKEFRSDNLLENNFDGRSIKAYCRKLTVDRLGRITKIE